jgi:hypothetical protein
MFFIRDCNDAIVGNPKGYKTMRGAEAQYANKRSAVYRAIWAAVDARKAAEDAAGIPLEARGRRICSIRLNEEI